MYTGTSCLRCSGSTLPVFKWENGGGSSKWGELD